jgi:hypothetical protein
MVASFNGAVDGDAGVVHNEVPTRWLGGRSLIGVIIADARSALWAPVGCMPRL